MKIPRTNTFPLTNPAQNKFLLHLCKCGLLSGGSFFCDEGKFPGDQWKVNMPDGRVTLFISYPEFNELVNKWFLSIGSEGWHSTYGDGIRRKSFECSLSGITFDYNLWNISPWWKKFLFWLWFNIKAIFEIFKTFLSLIKK